MESSTESCRVAADYPYKLLVGSLPVVALGDEGEVGERVLLAALKDPFHTGALVDRFVRGSEFIGGRVHDDIDFLEEVAYRPLRSHLRAPERLQGLLVRGVDIDLLLRCDSCSVVGLHLRDTDELHIRLLLHRVCYSRSDRVIAVDGYPDYLSHLTAALSRASISGRRFPARYWTRAPPAVLT